MPMFETLFQPIAWLLAPLLEIRGRMVRRTLGRALSSRVALPAPAHANRGPLHIAYLANSPVPTRAANCVHVMKMCNALQRAGYCTTLLAQRSRQGDEAKLFEDFAVSPFNVCLLDSDKGSLVMEVARIEEALRRGVTHFFGRSLIGCYSAALTGAPSLLERHLPLKRSESTIAADLFSRTSFVGLIVISDSLKRWYTDRFAALADRIHVVPDAADPPLKPIDDFSFEAVEGTSFRVGYAGHLYPGKGAEIIAAAAQRMPHISFHILGGNDADVAKWRSKTAGLPNIVFYGFRPQRQVSAFLRGSDVMLTPYQRQVRVHGGGEVSAWMSPLKVFESMAHSKPIISSDLAVLREVLSPDVNALLCDPDDIESWVAAIERLKDDQDLRARLSERARRDFDTKYAWSRRAEKIVGLLTA
jgi:glycosyltransferase involved in cell wall biosynthesis